MKSTVNYRDTHFERANLTPIRGEPTYETVHKLWNEIKANARSVYSHRGGGTKGHLGLVLTAAQYSDTPPTVFTRPSHPAPLATPLAPLLSRGAPSETPKPKTYEFFAR